jgi:Eco29kI-like restriction endonuclease
MKPYDPLEYENLASSVVEAFLEGPQRPLPPDDSFEGSGVYAIYYHGDFQPYSKLVEANPVPAIYVGKADPAGARKGGTQALGGRELYHRLRKHSRNIEHAENLQVQDFTCRYLVLVPVWVTLAERFLVEHYQPVWNVAIDGFGNNPPGTGRSTMKRPLWDILHPGRPWAAKLTPRESVEEVLTKLDAFLDKGT